jgi:hypothetical protein
MFGEEYKCATGIQILNLPNGLYSGYIKTRNVFPGWTWFHLGELCVAWVGSTLSLDNWNWCQSSLRFSPYTIGVGSPVKHSRIFLSCLLRCPSPTCTEFFGQLENFIYPLVWTSRFQPSPPSNGVKNLCSFPTLLLVTPFSNISPLINKPV